MLYLLDANVLIEADRDYYPMNQIPQFWDWILSNSRAGKISIPREIYREITTGNTDRLSTWIRSNRKSLLLKQSAIPSIVSGVVKTGYASDLSTSELKNLGQDPVLIAYAMMNKSTSPIDVS